MPKGHPRLLMVVAFAAACSSGDGISSWTGTMTDSAGVTIVTNPPTGLWTDQTRWRLEEDVKIGTAGEDPNYQFGSITGIVPGRAGELFVLDQQAAHIKVFDEAGSFLRTMGRPGSGPGEINSLGAAALLHGPGDTILVADIGNARVLRFLEDGSAAGSFRVDMANGIPFRWDEAPGGRVVTQLRRMSFGSGPTTVDTLDTILSRSADGETSDTLMQIPSGGTISARGGTPEIKFFSPEPIWALGPTGVLYGVNDDYRIGQYDGRRLTRLITKPFDRPAVVDEDKEILTEAVERAWQQAGVPPQAITQLRSRMSFGEQFPAFLQILSGPAASVWVQHIRVPSELSEGEKEDFNPLLSMGAAEWDIFDSEGRYLGVLTMPAKYQPLRIRGDRIYGIWRDDLEVQYAMVLQVTDASGGAIDIESD